MNDKTRAFAKRFAELDRGIHPNAIHAGVYSATLHYLKAVEALKGDDGTKVIAKMKETPTDDPLFGKGSIRADGRKLHPCTSSRSRSRRSRRARGTTTRRADDAGGPGVPAHRPGVLPPGEEYPRPHIEPCPSLPRGERVSTVPLPSGEREGDGDSDSPMIFGIPPQPCSVSS